METVSGEIVNAGLSFAQVEILNRFKKLTVEFFIANGQCPMFTFEQISQIIKGEIS